MLRVKSNNFPLTPEPSTLIPFFITDSNRVDPVKICEKLPPQTFVVFRDYDHPNRYELGSQLRAICKKRDLSFLVGKDYNLARELKADGMHFPEFMIPKISEIKSKHPDWIITAASHGEKAIVSAKNAAADYIFLSLLFTSDSHPDIKPLGIVTAGKLAMKFDNIVGLGGISLKHIKLLENCGFVGFAGVTIFKNVL